MISMIKAVKCQTREIDDKESIEERSITESTTLKVDKSLIAPRKMEYLKKGFFSSDTMVPDVARYYVSVKNI